MNNDKLLFIDLLIDETNMKPVIYLNIPDYDENIFEEMRLYLQKSVINKYSFQLYEDHNPYGPILVSHVFSEDNLIEIFSKESYEFIYKFISSSANSVIDEFLSRLDEKDYKIQSPDYNHPRWNIFIKKTIKYLLKELKINRKFEELV